MPGRTPSTPSHLAVPVLVTPRARAGSQRGTTVNGSERRETVGSAARRFQEQMCTVYHNASAMTYEQGDTA